MACAAFLALLIGASAVCARANAPASDHGRVLYLMHTSSRPAPWVNRVFAQLVWFGRAHRVGVQIFMGMMGS